MENVEGWRGPVPSERTREGRAKGDRQREPYIRHSALNFTSAQKAHVRFTCKRQGVVKNSVVNTRALY